MLRKQFLEAVSSLGLATVTDLKVLSSKKDDNQLEEFNLLSIPTFDEKVFIQKSSEKYNLKTIDLSRENISEKILSLMSKKDILRFRAIPIRKTDQKIVCCSFDPSVRQQINELNGLLKKEVELVLVTISQWKALLGDVKESIEELLDTLEEVGVDDDIKEDNKSDIGVDNIGQNIIQFVNKLLIEAFSMKASDIHVESYEKKFRIRMRVDGSLVEVAKPSRIYQLPVISRLKIMGSMDIAERRLPQDGRIKLRVGGQPIDYRVSSLPTLFGEKVVLRLLDQSNLQLDMTRLGFENKQLQTFKEGFRQPYGICLVVGPTGSGKTTTLYSALSELNDPTKNIVTVEDPVEFNLDGINQVNVKSDIGLTFSSALKSFLRQDPDIMMVGEIRDAEVGEIAIEAALTGHMVLSTIHTNDAPSTVTRLLNMGIEPFLIIASLNVIVAQRLCRKICSFCKKIHSYSVEELVSAGFAEKSAKSLKLYKGEGCDQCVGTGYKGRLAIYEVLNVTHSIKQLIIEGASSSQLKYQAMKEGMKTLRMSALMKVAQGSTTIEEALKSSASDKR